VRKIATVLILCFLLSIINTHTSKAREITTSNSPSASNFFQGVFGIFGNSNNTKAKVKHNTHKNIKHKSQLTYEGYSKSFIPIKHLLIKGKFTEVSKIYENKDAEAIASCKRNAACFVKKIGFLGCVERGSVFLDIGKPDKSIYFFTGAEFVLKNYENWSKAHTALSNVFSFITETVSGNDEIKPYYGTGFERVLMLNYKTIVYMLKGERKAYNVTRRAIDWQNIERKVFEEKYKEVAKKLREKDKKLKEKNVKSNIRKQVANVYKHTDMKASKVASAYVNPFGYYMAGVMQEFESLEDSSLIYNARISYKKALLLNPKSRVINSAVRDLKKRKHLPKNLKLVHLIINEGFAPEKKVVTYHFEFGGAYVPIKLAVYDPVKQKPYYIEVKTLKGKKIASLSPIADIEAIVLRHQKDMEPFVTLRITTTLLRYYLKRKLLGDTLAGITEGFATPDTRSWMMLPKTILGARFYLPKSARKIMVVVYDKNHNIITKSLVNIRKSGPTFIYGVHADKFLKLYNNKKLWIKNTY